MSDRLVRSRSHDHSQTGDGTALVPESIEISGGPFAWRGHITPSQITGTQNDYNPTGLADGVMLRLSSDASQQITGLAGGVNGRVVGILNVGAQDIVLVNESASSSAANRFALDANETLIANTGCVLWYDPTASRWRMVASSIDTTSGGAGAPTDADYLVGTANGSLSAEIVVGTSPGGELGGTWASPTVDATHSGSAHHTQAHAIDGADHTGDIETTQIANDAVTYAKIQNVATSRLLGRATAGSGDVEEIALGTNLSFSGTTLNAAGGGGAVATDTIWDAAGDLAVGSGADTASRLAVGADRTVLMALASETLDMKWEKMGRVALSTETQATVVNTTTETNLFSLALPAGLVAAGDRLHVVAGGTILNNSGGAVNYTPRFKIGTTTVLTSVAVSLAASANRRMWHMDLVIAIASTTSQKVSGVLEIGTTTATAWQALTATAGNLVGYGTAAEDTSAANRDIILSIEMGTASASADMVLEHAAVEFIRKP